MLDAAAGLTRFEAENAFSLSLVRHGRLAPDVIWELKSQTLKKSGLMTLHRGGETFADLGGLEALKAFCRRSLTRQDGNPLSRPRGVLLLGVPGTGKCAFCKALGNETGRPTLILDVGALMGSLVGQTEERTRQALRIADAMAPCIVFCRRGREGPLRRPGQRPDRQRRLGPDVRHAADLAERPRERRLLRLHGQRRLQAAAGVHPGRAVRRDVLPRPARSQEKEKIWRLYLEKFGLDPSQQRPRRPGLDRRRDPGLLPAGGLLDVPLVEAATNIVPVAVTAGESVERLRNWASGRCLSADRPGIYSRVAESSGQSGRKVHRGDASLN